MTLMRGLSSPYLFAFALVLTVNCHSSRALAGDAAYFFDSAQFRQAKSAITSNVGNMCVTSSESFVPMYLAAKKYPWVTIHENDGSTTIETRSPSISEYQNLLRAKKESEVGQLIDIQKIIGQYAYVPSEVVRHIVFEKWPTIVGIKDTDDVRKMLADEIPTPEIKNPFYPERLSLKDAIGGNSNFVRDAKDFAFDALGVCAEIDLMDSISCAKVITLIGSFFGDEDFPVRDLSWDVLSNPRYDGGLRRTANLIMDKVEHGGVPQGDLYTDLVNSYRLEGFTEVQAEEYAMNILGFMAQAGFGIVERLGTISDPKLPEVKKLAIMTIIFSSPVLDSRSLSTKHIYSFPKNVYSSCDSGKSYHFWMAAYLAHHLSKQSSDTTAIQDAVYLLEKGYQMLATDGNRDPARTFAAAPLSDINNRVRIDLAYGAAAIRFGLKGTQAGILNVDNAIIAQVNAAKDVPTMPKQEAQTMLDNHPVMAYLRWEQIFAPNQAIRSFPLH